MTDHRVGKRVELHPGTDLWMRGARYGTVVRAKGGLLSVKMDHPQVRKLVKLPTDRVTFIDYASNPRAISGAVVAVVSLAAAGIAWLLWPSSTPATAVPPIPPGPPPPPSAPPPPSPSGVSGPDTHNVYFLKRRYGWNGQAWVLDDQYGYFMSTDSMVFASQAGWPGMLDTPASSKQGPPYYYSDIWQWDEKWQFLACYTNWTSPNCTPVR